MHKLKTVLRGSHRKRDSTSSQSPRQSYESSEATSPRVAQPTGSPTQHDRSSIDAVHGQSAQGRRSRPVSAAYDENCVKNVSPQHYVPTGIPVGHDQSTPSNSLNGSIANDYRSYLPALAPTEDRDGDGYMTLGGDRRLLMKESDRRHEEDVADRNIDRFSSSANAASKIPLHTATGSANTTNLQNHQVPVYPTPHAPSTTDVPPRNSSRQAAGRDVPTDGGLVDSIQPHEEVSEHTSNSWKQRAIPPQGARDESHLSWSRRRPQGEDSDDEKLLPHPEEYIARRDMAVQPVQGTSTMPATSRLDNDTEDWKRQQKTLLDGVVDLSNTVDVDKYVRIAAPIVHEVVKPHEHEIIQKKIYREIHNYTYYHRIQPVMHTEVLPPRHFIPNPNGEGLIEISADELPLRTGKNRWWEIVQKEVPQTYEIQSKWRTKPEVIESEPYITEEGFERHETTIIYPPKLEDMSEYDGVVQPVHFDHKTGERWMGEVTTMAKLREQYSQDMLTMNKLTEDLPQVPRNSSVHRKPVGV